MSKSIILTLLVLFIFSSVMSQGGYKSGYIVNTKNDTIAGLIKNRALAKEFISFKKPGERQVNYFPVQVKEYFMEDGRHFIAREVPVPGELPKYVFVEALVEGKLSIYAYGDKIMAVKDGIEELQVLEGYHREELTKGGSQVVGNKRYIGVLKWLMNDCQKMEAQLKTLKFTKKSIANIVREYNSCQ